MNKQTVDIRLTVSEYETAENILQIICDELPNIVLGGVVLENDGFGNIIPVDVTRVGEDGKD